MSGTTSGRCELSADVRPAVPRGHHAWRASAPLDIPGLSDEDLLRYVKWQREQGLSEKTVLQRWDFARQWYRRWGTWDVAGDQVALWLAGYTGWSRRTYFNHLRSLYTWLVEAGEVDGDPTARMKRPKAPRPQPKPLTAAQLAAVLEYVDDTSGVVRAWVHLAYYAGLRCHEVAKFRGEDITATDLVVVGKGGKVETLPTHPALWDLAQAYPRTGYWFTTRYHHVEHVAPFTVANGVTAVFRELGVEKGSIHRLRATYGTNLVRAGTDLNTVRDLMRHSSLDTTQAYLGVDEDSRRSAIGGL